jgi:hypothetical protein
MDWIPASRDRFSEHGDGASGSGERRLFFLYNFHQLRKGTGQTDILTSS